MAEVNDKQQFVCTGDCLACRALNDRKVQWQYCAAQHAYNTTRMLMAMQKSIEAISATIEEIKQKIASIQDNEALVFKLSDSTEEDENEENDLIEDTAQKGDGAGRIDAPKQTTI